MEVETIISKSSITVDKDQLISHALDLMEKNEISQLLVMDEDKLVGLLTEKSIADRLGSSRLDSLQASSIHISAAMVSISETVTPKTEIESAAEIMLKTGRSALPAAWSAPLPSASARSRRCPAPETAPGPVRAHRTSGSRAGPSARAPRPAFAARPQRGCQPSACSAPAGSGTDCKPSPDFAGSASGPAW